MLTVFRRKLLFSHNCALFNVIKSNSFSSFLPHVYANDLNKNAIELDKDTSIFAKEAGISHYPSELIIQILTHKSHYNGEASHNDRLNYIGTTFLEFYGIKKHTGDIEESNILDFQRNELYRSRHVLSIVATNLMIPELVRFTDFEGTNHNPKIVGAQAVAALVGAIYHYEGIQSAEKFVSKFIDPIVKQIKSKK
ncbi:hypothetical protein ROZALSC1DRAFT_30340 [Rozella allomycis CSF55]|uniref:RNase III domain-containing protein n=1 Tax=Rozella allomycis (strain CSF55) TaxID=988480 RepID=A0A075B2G9_ROZAC|nr:hypothetical protein O9G_003194 [Rozella allomycis CSF55]RKP17894.1 hypothetical protein ROZALSC1DRAFT_30340 [Rozella allomycis CSF55]|eukprot:EPZ35008.1 hypothetical protein O9G_003194 [Rozella allomycis CSF55]